MGSRSGRVSVVAYFVVVAVATSCAGDGRSALRWSDLQVSDDRRTLTVTTYHGPFCRKIADGVDVDVRDDEIVVAAWLSDIRRDGQDTCTAECGMVTQSVTLADPLPEDRPFRPPANHALGCGEIEE